jgi:Family of unknown function (DUF5677)
MPSESPREVARKRAALRACRDILKTTRAVRQRHSQRVEKSLTDDGWIINALIDKTLKTARAVLILATRDYAEDAFVLARSLAGLTIDLAYLSANDKERFTSYRAVGRTARRLMAEQSGFTPPDAKATDWDDVKGRARRWRRSGAIEQRARKSNRLRSYEYSYRHGSSYEHSDAWSLTSYDRKNRGAGAVVLHLALLVTAHSVVMAMESWSRFFDVTDSAAEAAFEKHFLRAFPAKTTTVAASGTEASRS